MGTDKRARQRENRDKQLAERARKERNEKLVRRGRFLLVIAVVVGIFWWLTTRDTGETEVAAPESAIPPSSYDEFFAQGTACGDNQPPARAQISFDEPDDLGLSGVQTATLNTSCGSVTMTLDADASPETVNSFLFLAQEGYFDGTACHRLVPGFVLQCGDPSATGVGEPGYRIADEFPDDGFVYEQGVIAMANAGSGTTGSQFFLVIGDASFLGPEFNVLGTFEDAGLIEALGTVPLAASPRGEVSVPLETIYINSVSVGG